MFRKTSVKLVTVLVALLICLAVVFTACNGAKDFKPVELPQKGEVESNGGIAVKYGEWLYYVNGYESSVDATNTYVDLTDAPRIGSIVRIKYALIEDLLALEGKDEIAQFVRDNAETVVPNIYYSANTTSTYLNGIYIFGDRIYITTPNDELTPGGNSLTSQSVLMSYNLGGGDAQRHYVFTSNSAQIWLSEVNGKVIATYIMNSELHSLDVSAGTDTLISNEGETVSSFTIDRAGKNIFFLDADGSICKLAVGATEYEVLVENEKPEGHDHSHVKYTIKSVNNGYVYYTVSDSNDPTVDNVVLYYANSEKTGEMVLATSNVTPFYGWNDSIVYVKQDSGYYGIYVTNGDGSEIKMVVSPQYNDASITFDRIEGDVLYYHTSSSVYFTLDLTTANESKEGTAYAKSLGAPSSWYQPDLIDNYVFTLGAGSISVVKFDAEKKTNSTSVALTLTVAPEEE